MLTSPDAERVGNAPSDTGWDKFSKTTPPYLDAAIADDCKADIAAMRAAPGTCPAVSDTGYDDDLRSDIARLNAEQIEDGEEIQRCYARIDDLTSRVIAREKMLSEYRKSLLEHRGWE